MRSYQQYCGLARGLDVIGDRWTLLLVRELLEGPRRYNELLYGLPGIATNLLAERLRTLEEAEVVERRDDLTYALTEWGEGLRETVYAIGRWARPLMKQPAKGDEFRSHWLTHPINLLFDDVNPRRPPLTIEVNTGEAPMTVKSAGGRVSVVPGRADAPDLVLSGPPHLIVLMLGGKLNRAGAARRGVTVSGDARKLAKLLPTARWAGANVDDRSGAGSSSHP
jgi:DNA-binding HxlR family transcriptional regulator